MNHNFCYISGKPLEGYIQLRCDETDVEHAVEGLCHCTRKFDNPSDNIFSHLLVAFTLH